MKYRLWNKYKKCWETDCYTISRNGEVYFIDYGEICGCFPSKTHVLQRSLGLKDIYGIEIFEGDIVKIDYGDELLIGTMEFYDFAWCIKSKYKNGKNLYYPIFCEDVNLIEILGNIYENPELLEYK